MKRLNCTIQHYQWGKRGQESAVARLSNRTIEEDEYYAELWMGTHPNGPSRIMEKGGGDDDEEVCSDEDLDKRGTLLADYIKENPEMGQELNFLFKVLSVGKALSIQAHPTKEQAKILNAQDPKNYPDANHKPEMAIALTDFELLCGFQNSHGILSNVRAHKELLELVGEDLLAELAHGSDDAKQRMALKKIFTQIWTSDEEKIKQTIQEILARIYQKDEQAPVDKLMIRLSEQFPDDIGILAPLFLNYFTLKPGEATFLGPNEPHAYLAGDCVECMALSDNTIRAGLTPKFKDVETLCQNLTYQMFDEPPMFKPVQLPNGVVEYAPNVEEFAVHKIDNNVAEISLLNAPSILIVVSGEATIKMSDGQSEEAIHAADVFFLPQQFNGELTGKKDDFLAFRAFSPPK